MSKYMTCKQFQMLIWKLDVLLSHNHSFSMSMSNFHMLRYKHMQIFDFKWTVLFNVVSRWFAAKYPHNFNAKWCMTFAFHCHCCCCLLFDRFHILGRVVLSVFFFSLSLSQLSSAFHWLVELNCFHNSHEIS